MSGIVDLADARRDREVDSLIAESRREARPLDMQALTSDVDAALAGMSRFGIRVERTAPLAVDGGCTMLTLNPNADTAQSR